jgi:hypothetical protein
MIKFGTIAMGTFNSILWLINCQTWTLQLTNTANYLTHFGGNVLRQNKT